MSLIRKFSSETTNLHRTVVSSIIRMTIVIYVIRGIACGFTYTSQPKFADQSLATFVTDDGDRECIHTHQPFSIILQVQ